MNFILPDIFDDLDSFQEWFNLPTLQSSLPNDQSAQIISALHSILKPFLLRRLKVDVLGGLPPKKEYVLYAPLSVRQKEAYHNVLNGTIRRWLMAGGTAKGGAKLVAVAPQKEEGQKELSSSGRLRKRLGKKNYDVDGDDDEYFDMVERGLITERGIQPQLSKKEEAEEQQRLALEFETKEKGKSYPHDIMATTTYNIHSEGRQQYEAPECGHATTESLLAPIPIRVAYRPNDDRTYSWR